ncbi:hypothetical protein J6590_003558 [Homalodisca vitripennis]|nr:hypothetical protein J6590_003558 [Homalodisca vitripennis]
MRYSHSDFIRCSLDCPAGVVVRQSLKDAAAPEARYVSPDVPQYPPDQRNQLAMRDVYTGLNNC